MVGWCGGGSIWPGLPVSGSEQLSSDEKRLQCESATEGMLPLRDGESSSEELARRCSRSRASMSPCVSFTLLSPLLLPLLALLQSLLLHFLPAVVAVGSLDQEDEGPHWLPGCPQLHAEGHGHKHPSAPAALMAAEPLLQLASSMLLLALPCLILSCLDSESTGASRLPSLQNTRHV